MGLFEAKKRPEKNRAALFHVDVENITKDEFNRLKQWVKENIPSTERYTPEWKSDDSLSDMEKLRFRFTHEEHAMAFKLVI